ncbi:MAG: hypothetical protein WCS33_00735 [Candidatus Caldatribacteriota bacterium]
MVSIAQERNSESLLNKEFNNTELENAPQVKTEYGLYIYTKEIIVLAKATKRSLGITDKKYKKVNRKSYKNLTWLNRMYERRIKESSHLTLIKVIMPLDFPNGYKLYDQDGKYYATVVGKNDIFLYLVIRYKNKPTMFLEKGMDRYYIQAQDGKYGLTVPLEFVEKYERPD